MKRLTCLLWGHTILPIASDTHPAYYRLTCMRCLGTLGLHPRAERVPGNFHWRHWQHITLGPLRRVYEYLSCQLLGHDEKWEAMETRFAHHTVCQTCGQSGRLLREEPQ